MPLVTALITFFSPESDAELPSAEDDAAEDDAAEPLLLPAFADALLPHPAKLAAKRPAAANTAQNFFVFFIIKSSSFSRSFQFRPHPGCLRVFHQSAPDSSVLSLYKSPFSGLIDASTESTPFFGFLSSHFGLFQMVFEISPA